MPSPTLRTLPASLLVLLVCVLSVAAPADAANPLAREMDAARMHHIRAGLAAGGPPAVQLEALGRRAAPSSLQLAVVGFDFSDSLMWGRNPADFPGWPVQTRESQRIPGTGVHVFAAHDSTYFDLQLRRVDAYLRTVSFGAFSMNWAVHGEILNVDRPMGWFADPDSGVVRLAWVAQEIARAVDGAVDFSGVDTFVLIHAGAGSETDIDGNSPSQIPTDYLDHEDFEAAVSAGLLDDPWISTGEGQIEHVLILPESETQDALPGIPGSGFFDVRGVYCYEFGLRLGMLSLADFTPSFLPDSQGIGNFGLMGYGLFTGLGIVPSAPSAINRMLMGWAEPVDVTADADLRISPMLDPATTVGDTNLVRVPITDREYWLLEYRLQDPDGDLFYGFEDLNSNRVPDYWDASNAAGGGVPDSTFDPSVDTWEDEAGAEVDFFMSENPARTPDGCRRGGGSGLYIWHIDEQVIENALISGTNTINADPRHKGVDVEEADGIQDLDTAYSGLWLLGGDHDSWRGEGAPEFGPGSSPSTASNAGLSTGVRFASFSDVVADSLPKSDGYCTGFVYAPAMRVRVEFGANANGPVEQARLRFDGYAPQFDLRVLDLGSSPGSTPPDGVDEIVALGDGGRVFAFAGDLSSFNPAASEPGLLATASAGDSLRWTGPPALLDFDGDLRPDILAGANAGPFGFDLDGAQLADGDADPATNGRLADPEGQGVGPLVALGEAGAMQAVQAGTGLRLVAVDAGAVIRTDVVAGVRGRGWLVEAPGGSAVESGYARDGESGWVRWTLPDGMAEYATSPDDFARGPVTEAELGSGGVLRIWSTGDGALVAGWTEAIRSSLEVEGAVSAPIAAPVSRTGSQWVVAFTTASALWAFDANLAVMPGFPAKIGGTIAASEEVRPVEPVAVDLDGDDRIELIWADAAGGIHATSLDGRELPGWPVQGPASPVSAPALGQFDADASLELVVASRFERLEAAADSGSRFESRTVGEIRVYDLAVPDTAWRPWPQARGGVDNRARQALTAAVPTGSGLVADSFSVRPNPATGDVIRLRADANGEVQARMDIYTLEGERVLGQGPFMVPAGSAIDVEFRIDELGSGTYICQLTAGGTVQRRILAVVR